MKGFFKIFFASFFALAVFTFLSIVIFFWIIGGALEPSTPKIGEKGVLVINLENTILEQARHNPLESLLSEVDGSALGLYDVVRMIHHAKTDSSIKGIYIKAAYNANGFATSEELRTAIIDFKTSRKFVLAYGESIDQKSYYVATAADKIFCHPNGGVDWDGFALTSVFMKGLLDKLEVEPQVFYAGKYKSATEPFRLTRMSDENRAQTTELLSDMYAHFLQQAAAARKTDTATLHRLALTGAVRTANDAVQNHLVDGLKYDDEVRAEIAGKLGISKDATINFVELEKYEQAVNYKKTNGEGAVAIIYAQGDIVSGESREEQIGSDDYIKIIRKARLDDDIEAIVFRVNSPGGSALASDAIWREISLAKKDKPVVVSMGDYAASGGYYISCNADSVFADMGTITGSIGVFSIIPNIQGLMNDKLGITFDGVKTAPYADMGLPVRPLTAAEKNIYQASVDSIYATFKTRVADGRKQDPAFIESIAQGHVYTGQRAIAKKLVDKTGTLQDAVACAARMAELDSYRTEEYPEKKSFWQQLTEGGLFKTSGSEAALKEQLGDEQFRILQQVKKVQQFIAIPQARLPMDLNIH